MGATANYESDDLTTMVTLYLRSLLPWDQSVEFQDFLNTTRQRTGEVDDLNTSIFDDLAA